MSKYIRLLNLLPHPQGGYFKLFYQSQDKIKQLNKRYDSAESEKNSKEEKLTEHNAGSSIYYLLEKQQYSAWHRLRSDEIWHYYDGGSPIDIHTIDPIDGKFTTYTLGKPGVTKNAKPQVAIKAGVWFAAELRDKSSFGLAGCTVSPTIKDCDSEFALQHRDKLIGRYPELTSIIDKFIQPKIAEQGEQVVSDFIPPDRSRLSADEYIQQLNLERHQEGGCFCVNYTATDIVIPLDPRYKNQQNDMTEVTRKAGSAIYFLLDKKDFSAWHQLKSDEIWHYYDGGSPIDIYVIDSAGNIKTLILGNPKITENASFQVFIKAGEWFAAKVRNDKSFGLVGCTVSPGFVYEDFVLAERKDLVALYQQHESIINELTRTTSTVSKSWATKAIRYSAVALVAGIGLYAFTRKNTMLSDCVNNVKLKLGI